MYEATIFKYWTAGGAGWSSLRQEKKKKKSQNGETYDFSSLLPWYRLQAVIQEGETETEAPGLLS